jgi:hypothetical protein
MSFRDDVQYHPDHEFTREELAAVTPEQLVEWMSVEAYGVRHPRPDDQPHILRSSTLEQYKKAISHFMPNNNVPYNEMAGVGNPTRSMLLNNMIKKVRKQECRKQGKPSQARRNAEASEFEQIIALTEADNQQQHRLLISAFFRFQLHLIARVDDVSKVYCVDIRPHPLFNFALLTKLCWSKNVMDERDCPDQIILGAKDRKYCVLIGLAIHLETWIESGTGAASEFIFDLRGTNDPEHTKDVIGNYLTNRVLNNEQFRVAGPGLLGTHSIRKFAVTYARRNGCNQDVTEVRGRWKKQRRQVDTYTDPNIPFADAQVAATLCKGGPCKYVLKPGSGIISDEWITDFVCPHIASRFQRGVALVLGRALLWAIFDTATNSYIPAGLRNRIKTAYEHIPAVTRRLNVDENPIRKIEVFVTGNEGQVIIDEIDEDDEDNNNNTNTTTTNNNGVNGGAAAEQQEIVAVEEPRVRRQHATQVSQQHFRIMRAHILTLQREMEAGKAQNERSYNRLDRKLNTINQNLMRLMMQPARVIGPPPAPVGAAAAGGDDGANDEEQVAPGGRAAGGASLSPLPKTIHDLWHEYEFGIGGRKPARDFTAAERGGRNKHTYYRRRVVWDVVAALVRAGWTSQAACDEIYRTYGRAQSVTYIINRMLEDRRGGGHPNLVVHHL